MLVWCFTIFLLLFMPNKRILASFSSFQIIAQVFNECLALRPFFFHFFLYDMLFQFKWVSSLLFWVLFKISVYKSRSNSIHFHWLYIEEQYQCKKYRKLGEVLGPLFFFFFSQLLLMETQSLFLYKIICSSLQEFL